MQHLSQDQIMAMAKPIPMSRDDKLERWALLIERSPGPVLLFHGLEYKSRADLDRIVQPHRRSPWRRMIGSKGSWADKPDRGRRYALL
jgi:hypothetical protein